MNTLKKIATELAVSAAKGLALLALSFLTVPVAKAIEPEQLIGTYRAENCATCYLQLYPDKNGTLQGDLFPWGSFTSFSDGPKSIAMVTSTRMLYWGDFYDIVVNEGKVELRPLTGDIKTLKKVGVIDDAYVASFNEQLPGIYQATNCPVCMVKFVWNEKERKVYGDMSPWGGNKTFSNGMQPVTIAAPGEFFFYGDFYRLEGGNGFKPTDRDLNAVIHEAYLVERVGATAAGPMASFDPRNLEKSLQSIGNQMYPAKKVFLDFLVGAMETISPRGQASVANFDAEMARLFALNGLAPFMNDIKSDWFEKSILPQYQAALATANQKYQVQSLVDLPVTANVRRMAVAIVQAGAESAKASLASGADRALLAELQTAAGRALASPMKHDDVDAFLKAYQKGASTFDALAKNPRMQGVGISVQAVVEFLQRSQ